MELKINPDKCVGCFYCLLLGCKNDAIKGWTPPAKIDYDKCKLCLSCVSYCPVKAIKIVE